MGPVYGHYDSYEALDAAGLGVVYASVRGSGRLPTQPLLGLGCTVVADPPRYLARDSSQGYVDHESRALRSGKELEPEPIPAELQRQYSAKARQTFEIVKAEEVARKQSRSRCGRLKKVDQDARRLHVDIHKQLVEIERQIGIAEALVHPAT